jgi:hypothetical protein
MLRVADEALSTTDFAAASHFVACFSEVEDDLGQWRGYGSGECDYAIGFRPDGILEALKSRPSALLLPMNYEDSKHKFLVEDVMRIAEVYFLDGLKRGLSEERWAKEFLAAFSEALDIFACVIKHPKFSGAAERRITTHLQVDEHKLLQFRQKRTLLARHLPLDLTQGADGVNRSRAFTSAPARRNRFLKSASAICSCNQAIAASPSKKATCPIECRENVPLRPRRQ